jgi:glycosyltransferase involved in cell wall biosynthesis
LVGYDCIPAASPETVNAAEMDKFGRYLELVKHADRLAAISHSTAREFEGFNRALSAQGLPGPEVVACPLPHTVSFVGAAPASRLPERAVVVSVGSLGRRKNQVALVEAAELLWRDGMDFELRLLGHPLPERSPLWELVRGLQKLGRPLTVEKGVSDARIAESLAEARCLVFPSLHEGFGLPVVEALSQLVPVITSDFGSLREVAEGQGGMLVDPEDVDQLSAAIRDLLTDDGLHARLVAEAAARPVRTWSNYADELWEVLLA